MTQRPPFFLRPFSFSDDYLPCLRLLLSAFGDDPRHEEGLRRWADDPLTSVLVADAPTFAGVCEHGSGASVITSASFSKPALAGLAVAGVEDALLFASRYAEFSPPPLPSEITRLGVFRLLAIDPCFQRQGLGSALGSAQKKLLQGAPFEVQAFLGISWLHGGRDSSKSLFEREGFRCVGRSTTFYPRLHETSGRPCPRCKKACSCHALLFLSSP